jgi:A/G-specific adenine glycosylase|tara:strand:+ start:2300 stop:3370 length:1071 start_codon:yes stop_codon:yes gene_type:complete
MDWFARQLLDWFEINGRKDLPWQADINPYRVWVSEIMLQQTQVATVIDYFNRFTQRFPNIKSLAQANIDEVLHLWTGLGYYARGRNLHKSAQLIVENYKGQMPNAQESLEALPGIGRSTAGAIRAIAMDQQGVIMDGNVKRVLARFHGIEGYPGESKISAQMWLHAADHTPAARTAAYTQAIMDLGATLCTRKKPTCTNCPMQKKCVAHAKDIVHLLPTPKAKKAKPLRSARFFVVSLQNGATLMEQRPATGLWGGLWNPPERSSETSIDEYLAELGLDIDAADHHRAKIFRHTFTHFHLDVEPIYISLKDQPELKVAETNTRWVLPAHLENNNEAIGLSAVAVKLLAPLAASPSE